MQRAVSVLIAVIALSCFSFGDGHAENRVALVIGNSQYAHTQRLANPENDARLIASILRQQGFEVMEHLNLDFKAMKRAIKDYTSKLETRGKDAVGLIFYAGHGVQFAGRNYLVPVDALIEKQGDVEIEAISSQDLLSGVQVAGNHLNIIILDACRNNPYRAIFRSAPRGFARMDAPVSSLVAFSTAPGMVAADGTAANSPYTAALAKAMVQPGLKIEEIFKRVRRTVHGETGGRQVPWESSSIFSDFYFSGAETGKPDPNARPSPAAEAWAAVQDSTDKAVLLAFLEQFPDTVYAALAKARLEALSAPEAPANIPADVQQGGRVYTTGCSGNQCWLALLSRVEQLPIPGAWEVDILKREWAVDGRGRSLREGDSVESKTPNVMVVCNESWPQLNFDGKLVELDRMRYRQGGFVPRDPERSDYELWWAVCRGELKKYSKPVASGERRLTAPR